MKGSFMSLIDKLSQEDVWREYLAYKKSNVGSKNYVKDLEKYIDDKKYLLVCDEINKGDFPLPRKSMISKLSSDKKRTVYTYPYSENMVLKLLTWLVLRKYDVFSSNLYSFRQKITAKDAVRKMVKESREKPRYIYKADIHNYFNSIDIDRLLPVLKETLSDDERFYTFLQGLLKEDYVISENERIIEEKGIMAGTPIASFYANLYLSELDKRMEKKGVVYARYSDDILVMADSLEEVKALADEIRSFIIEAGLSINPDKESFFTPNEGWVFLGFCFDGKNVDIAPKTVEKLKGKMYRKSRSLLRWSDKNNIDGKKAAKAFIKKFNKKLLEGAEDNELTWSLWFFSVISTADSLKVIDNYAQDCIRYVATGKRTKKRFDFRYEDMKSLGYKSLVHEYYSYVDDNK